MVDRSLIAKIIGNIEEPDEFLDEFINCIGRRWKYRKTKKGSIISHTNDLRSDSEVIFGAQLAKAFTYLATRTYEGRPLISGVMVAEEWALENESICSWILRLDVPIKFSIESLNTIEDLAQLADGKNSLLLAGTSGYIFGVIDVSGRNFEVLSIDYGGYLFITTRNREVVLFAGAAPLCHYNGFEWRCGIQKENIWSVAYWTWGKDIQENGLDELIWERSNAFVDIVDQLADLRLSSIIAVCDKLAVRKLQDKELILPLRPELNNAEWFEFETPPYSYVNIFRLDGVHFVSKTFCIIAACQRILGERSKLSHGTGTGKGAAQYLSKLLGKSAFVIKVSADGPIAVFFDGTLSQKEHTPSCL